MIRLTGEILLFRRGLVGTYGGVLPNLTVINKDYRYFETFENSLLDNVIFREFYDQIVNPLEINNIVSSKSVTTKVVKAQQLVNKHEKKVLQ